MLRHHNPTLGGDPEVFLSKAGRIIGSERCIPEEGLQNLVVRDGVQAELRLPITDSWTTVYPHTTIPLLGFLSGSLPPGVTVSRAECVEMDPAELMALSPTSRRLGCSPSLNIYTGPYRPQVPYGYLLRSAGGHLHLGLRSPIWNPEGRVDERRGLVPLLDVLVGNTSVLLNPGPDQAIRRTLYGKAGEYRLPSHGLEYRVPSNFWLWSRPYTELVFGLASFAVDVWHTTLENRVPLDDELFSVVNATDIRAAIDTNNVELAYKNFQAIMPFFVKYGEEMEDILAGEGVSRLDAIVGQKELEPMTPETEMMSFTKWVRR